MIMNMNKMTQKTTEAVQSAQSLCVSHQNHAIEPVHLLTALMQQSDGLIPQLMQRIGTDVNGLTRSAEQAVAALPHVSGGGRPADSVYISNATEQILTNAEQQAAQMQDEYTSVEHVFLAMLGSGDSALKKLFSQFRIEQPKVLAALKSGCSAVLREI